MPPPSRRLAASLALLWAGLLAGCGYISFSRTATTDEIVLQQELRNFYGELKGAFATGNADALAGLYDPSITHPMTQPEILAWGRKFFADNRTAHLRIEKTSVDELSYIRAVVTVSYKVETSRGKDDFSGSERDVLVKHRGRWYIASWDKVP